MDPGTIETSTAEATSVTVARPSIDRVPPADKASREAHLGLPANAIAVKLSDYLEQSPSVRAGFPRLGTRSN